MDLTTGPTMGCCSISTRHRCAVIEAHHVIPKSWFEHAGVPVNTPMVNICPTCHMDIHTGIDLLIAGLPIKFLPHACQKVAAAAIALAKEKGLTPAPTL